MNDSRQEEPAPGGILTGFRYEHDGMIHDDAHPAIEVPVEKRWSEASRCEPWTETPIYVTQRLVQPGERIIMGQPL